MQESHSAFSAGQHVVVRDERWTVLQAEAFDSACLLTLRGIAATNRDELHHVLTPFDRIRPVAAGTRVRHRSRRSVVAAAAAAVAEAGAWLECWTAAHARIDLLGWQLEPAVAAVSGSMRILLADSVGLGKTIQAALIVTELRARGLAERVLVLTPASLREQWADELRSRFALSPVIFDQGALAAAAMSLPPDVNPWRTAPLIITSIDLVKRPEVRAALDAAPFDVLIVDEAHHLTPGSDRGAVAAALAARTPWVVLVSATPHSGDHGAFEFLTDLGATTDALRVFRRVARRPSASTVRRSRLFMVTPTGAERALLEATREYLRALSLHGAGPGARLVGSVIARRAASSASAAATTLARRAALLAGRQPVALQPLLPWEEGDAVGDEVADSVLAADGLADVEREIAWVRRMIDLARTAALASSKLRVIRKLLTRTAEQVIVFSEYRDVALQFADALQDLAPVTALHGGLPPRARRAAVQSFNAGHIRVLVATDAAGEGLNLHHRCRLVVNVELPWTPLRLEQRIGRVDRLGQARRVHAIHLAHGGSYEGTVIARLERRRTLAAHASETVVDAHDAHAMRSRRLRGLASLAPGEAVYAARARAPAAVMLVFAVPVIDGRAAVVHRDVVAIRLATPQIRILRRPMVRALIALPQVQHLLDAHALTRLPQARHATQRAARAMESRLGALLRRLDDRRAGQIWQGALFDARGEQLAAQNAANAATLRAHLSRRRDAVHRLTQLRSGEPRLVAAWLSTR